MGHYFDAFDKDAMTTVLVFTDPDDDEAFDVFEKSTFTINSDGRLLINSDMRVRAVYPPETWCKAVYDYPAEDEKAVAEESLAESLIKAASSCDYAAKAEACAADQKIDWADAKPLDYYREAVDNAIAKLYTNIYLEALKNASL